ncbi:TPA: MASE4 domain-containing protein [Escherichia coli]|nr:MASE4 domain-containing protein [Escherichia coli]EIG0481224.1 MASE4 domain-containing protein [Escherichia coli]HDW3209746.1 MASE4 domain-containing protein [Escherichia coli]HEB5728630.1 MASE4 domain-containing protein [Escherichia coli]
MIIIQQPENSLLSMQMKANDTAIYYLFRQINFILLLFISVIINRKEQICQLNNKKK